MNKAINFETLTAYIDEQNPVYEIVIERALDRLDPEERQLLERFAKERPVIFTSASLTGRAGYFFMNEDHCELILSVMPSGFIHPGTVMHELGVHWNQWQTGDLAVKGGVFYWHGKAYDINGVHYMDLPWEIEAHRFEVEWLEEKGYVKDAGKVLEIRKAFHNNMERGAAWSERNRAPILFLNGLLGLALLVMLGVWTYSLGPSGEFGANLETSFYLLCVSFSWNILGASLGDLNKAKQLLSLKRSNDTA